MRGTPRNKIDGSFPPSCLLAAPLLRYEATRRGVSTRTETDVHREKERERESERSKDEETVGEEVN